MNRCCDNRCLHHVDEDIFTTYVAWCCRCEAMFVSRQHFEFEERTHGLLKRPRIFDWRFHAVPPSEG